jgi:predicted nucleic acid-binding protein
VIRGIRGFRRVFCDTSFFYSCLDPREVSHERALELARQAAEAGTILASTWDVIGETVTLLRYRRDYRSAVRFLDELKPRLEIALYGAEVRAAAEQIFRQHGAQRRLSFCDALSFVVVTTLLEGIPCLSFDEDFRALGLTVLA